MTLANARQRRLARRASLEKALTSRGILRLVVLAPRGGEPRMLRSMFREAIRLAVHNAALQGRITETLAAQLKRAIPSVRVLPRRGRRPGERTQ